MEETTVIDLHQIAGAKPGVAFGEHVTQDFLLGLRGVGVALEAAARTVRRPDPPHSLARLADGTRHAEAFDVTQRRKSFRVDPNDRGRETMRQQRRNSADRAGPAFDIVKRKIALGRRVELQDLRDRKPRLKIVPDVAAQAVAAGQPQPMLLLEFGWARFKK